MDGFSVWDEILENANEMGINAYTPRGRKFLAAIKAYVAQKCYEESDRSRDELEREFHDRLRSYQDISAKA